MHVRNKKIIGFFLNARKSEKKVITYLTAKKEEKGNLLLLFDFVDKNLETFIIIISSNSNTKFIFRYSKNLVPR